MISSIRRALKDIRSNPFINAVTIITIAFSVLIVSAYALVLFNARWMLDTWTRNIRIMVYLNSDVTESDIQNLQTEIGTIHGVHKVTFVPRQLALERLKSQMAHQMSILDNLDENPLPDAFEVRVKLDPDLAMAPLPVIASKIEKMIGVSEVEYGQQWLGKVGPAFHLLKLIGYALGCLFFLAAVFFVANTSRLVLYSRKQEVEIMRLVGASDSFIRDPFYIQSLIQGAVGGGLGVVMLFGIYRYVITGMQWAQAGQWIQLRFLTLEMIAGFIGGSMIVGWLGCFLALSRFLKSEY